MNVDVDIDQQDLERLKACLPVGEDVEATAEMIAKAGAMEMLLVATEKVEAVSSSSDMRRFRVYCLIRAGISMDRLEPIVAAIFKLTMREARGLVDSTMARYSAKLAADVNAKACGALNGAVADADYWIVTLDSHYVEARVLEFTAGQAVFAPTKLSVGRRWRFSDDALSAAKSHFCANGAKAA